MSYVPSNQVKVFPLAKNRPEDTGSRLLYESNIANIIRQLITDDGFIIKPEYKETLPFSLNDGEVKIVANTKFNLGGYYFEITASDTEQISVGTVSTAGDILYAGIKIENYEINGQDVDSNYEGLVLYIADRKNSDDYDYSLGLCMYDGSNLIKIRDSYQKFSLSDLNITGIDGKHNQEE